MANIIDTTYFIIDTELSVDEIQNELTSYIDRFEPEILTMILGYDLKKQFVDALAGTPAQKWLDLRDGKDFTVDGIYYNWKGMANTLKNSLIAKYVYYQYLVNTNSFTSNNGIKLVNSENAINTNPRQKQCLAYNSMVNDIKKMDYFINNQNSLDPSAYTNYNPITIERINIFNI